jgi:hypothetical protein
MAGRKKMSGRVERVQDDGGRSQRVIEEEIATGGDEVETGSDGYLPSPEPKRQKTSSIAASKNNAQPTRDQENVRNSSNAAAASNTESEGSRMVLLRNIHRNWQFERDSLVKQVPQRLRKLDWTLDLHIDLEVLQHLHDLSTKTIDQWDGKNGVRVRLEESLPDTNKKEIFCTKVTLKAIKDVRDLWTSQGQAGNGRGNPGQTASDAVGAPEVGNTDPSPAGMNERRRLVARITKAWGIRPTDIIPQFMLERFKYSNDPLKWDTAALKQLCELGIKKLSGSVEVSDLRQELALGYLRRIAGEDETEELTAEDSYYVMNNRDSWDNSALAAQSGRAPDPTTNVQPEGNGTNVFSGSTAKAQSAQRTSPNTRAASNSAPAPPPLPQRDELPGPGERGRTRNRLDLPRVPRARRHRGMEEVRRDLAAAIDRRAEGDSNVVWLLARRDTMYLQPSRTDSDIAQAELDIHLARVQALKALGDVRRLRRELSDYREKTGARRSDHCY